MTPLREKLLLAAGIASTIMVTFLLIFALIALANALRALLG